jgi:hypothetical protein
VVGKSRSTATNWYTTNRTQVSLAGVMRNNWWLCSVEKVGWRNCDVLRGIPIRPRHESVLLKASNTNTKKYRNTKLSEHHIDPALTIPIRLPYDRRQGAGVQHRYSIQHTTPSSPDVHNSDPRSTLHSKKVRLFLRSSFDSRPQSPPLLHSRGMFAVVLLALSSFQFYYQAVHNRNQKGRSRKRCLVNLENEQL